MAVSSRAAALGVVLVALVAGCGDDATEEPASLAGTSWALVDGVDVPQDIAVTKPTAAFDDEVMSGTTGCNTYGGSYTLDGDAIEIGALAMTQIACMAPADAIEAMYVDKLGDVRRWSLDGEELVLADDDGAELLRFAPTQAS